MKKLISILTAMIVALSILTISASAATRTVQDTGSGNISAGSTGHIGSVSGPSTANVSYGGSWELYAYYDSGNAVIRFGFNTLLVNEDYAYGLHKLYSHQATVKNNVYPQQSTPYASANSWTQKVDIKHGACPVWKLLF